MYNIILLLISLLIAFAFVRDKRLLSYYLNGNDAFKLKLFIPQTPSESIP
jgi:hypothetical protein